VRSCSRSGSACSSRCGTRRATPASSPSSASLLVDHADPLHWVVQVPLLAGVTAVLVVTYMRLRRPHPVVVRIVVAAVVLLPFALLLYDVAYGAFVH